MKPYRFKAPFLTNNDIEEKVQQIRSKYPLPTGTMPVDVLVFAEHDLGLIFEFQSLRNLKQDAILRPDLKGIIFDNFSFKDEASQTRLRFSAAHELGHYFLHDGVYGRLKFNTVRQWVAFIEDIPVSEYHWIEHHADEFAGRLLMPTSELSVVLDEAVEDALHEGFSELGQEAVLEHCCKFMRKHFRVSFQAIQTRVRKSGFWPHRKIASISN